MSFLIVFDTETGGVTPDKPTIQLAAVAYNEINWAECACFEAKLKFNESDADRAALDMNHYDPLVWAKEAITNAEALKKFDSWSKPYRSMEMISQRTNRPYYVGKLAGYNALTFDLPRLQALYSGQFFPFSYQVRDILQRVLFYFDEHKVAPPANFRLSTVCEYFNISAAGAHDALTDVRLAAALLRRLRA